MNAATSTLSDLLHQPLFEHLGWTLVHSVWQCAAAAVLLAVVLRGMKRASASSRYLAGCGALLLAIGASVVTFILLSQSSEAVRTTIATPILDQQPFAQRAPSESSAPRAAPSRAPVDSNTASWRSAIPWMSLAWLC